MNAFIKCKREGQKNSFMPKIIENLQQRILDTARSEMTEGGYSGLGIRMVAKKCGIATGTVYNYYPSKEMLVAAIMLDDWLLAQKSMREGCAAAADIREGIGAMFDALCAFKALYSGVWSEYSFTGSTRAIYRDRHVQLISQLADILGGLLSRFGAEADAYTRTFVAESLLTAAMEGHPFDKYAAVVSRIIDKE